MEAKHTATPWEANGEQVETESISLPEDELIICECFGPRAEENAAFIARACNAHEDLVNALKSLIRAGHYLAPSSHEWTAAHTALEKAGAA